MSLMIISKVFKHLPCASGSLFIETDSSNFAHGRISEEELRRLESTSISREMMTDGSANSGRTRCLHPFGSTHTTHVLD